jgi:hypothetical protein
MRSLADERGPRDAADRQFHLLSCRHGSCQRQKINGQAWRGLVRLDRKMLA